MDGWMDVWIDGTITKAPLGGKNTGPNPSHRQK
jgi:hypothetical protein